MARPGFYDDPLRFYTPSTSLLRHVQADQPFHFVEYVPHIPHTRKAGKLFGG